MNEGAQEFSKPFWLKVARFAIIMSRHVTYRLCFKTQWSKEKEYYGITEARGSQSPQQAMMIRQKHHLERPLQWMQDGVSSTFAMEVMGPTLSKTNALAEEVILTARALEHSSSSSRGACWSYLRLGAAGRETAKKVRRRVRGFSGQSARQAVLDFAGTLEEEHPLRCHLEDRPYKTSAKKTPPKVKLVTNFARRSSGGTGNQKRKKALKKGKYTAGSDEHRRLHRGVDPTARRQEETAKRPAKAMKVMEAMR